MEKSVEAGAVAYIDLADTPYGRGWTNSHEPLQMPVGRYLHESAAVPVEALEGLVVQLELLRHTADQSGRREDALFARGITAAITELTQLIERSKELIKERSNG